MTTLSLVIFDLDGTLLNTLSSLAEAYNHALTSLGYPPRPVDEYRTIIGDGARVASARCLPEHSRTDENIRLCLDHFRRYYDNTWQTASPYAGIDFLLDSLRSSGKRLAVLSNKDDLPTRQCVEYFFPGKFDLVLGHRPGTAHKPDPAGGLEIMRSLKASPEQTCLVGDTATDIRTAVACDVLAVGVLWGFRDEAELVAAGADRIVAVPSQLLNLV